MKNLLLSSASLICISTVAFGQSGTEVIDAIDGGIEMINSGESIFRFESREVGSDNSVTFTNVELGPEGDDVGFSTAWVKATPSSTNPGSAVFTIADTVVMNIDEGNEPLVITISSDDFVLETNLINGMSPTPLLNLSADSISVSGGSPSHHDLQNFEFKTTDFAISFNLDMIGRNVDASINAGSLLLDVQATEGGDAVEMAMTSEGMEIDFTAQNIPLDEDMIKGFVDNDGSFKLTAKSGAQTSKMKMSNSDFPLSLTAETGPGEGEISMIDGRLVYQFSGSAIHYNIQPDAKFIPFPPFNVNLAGMSLDIQLPLRKSANDQTAVMKMSMKDLQVDEVLWSMADPEGALPHDAANIEIDLAANVRIDHELVESLDGDGVADLPIPFMVGQANSVDINQVMLSVAGAVLDVNGGFEFNNSGPFPIPNGKVNISLDGAQAIANHLVSLGLIQQAEVGMVMGMMMAFMKQGSTPDSFSTVIEVNENGVTANGAPLPF